MDVWPDERRGDRTRYLLATAFLLVLALVSLLAGVVFTAAAGPIALLYGGLFATISVLAAALGQSLRDSPNSGRSGVVSAVGTVTGAGGIGPATRISAALRQLVLLVVLMSTCAAFCVLAAVGIATHGRGGLVMMVVTAVIGAFCASFAVVVALGRVRRGGVTLTASGIEQRGWSFENRLAWNDVAGIKPAYNGHAVILVIGYANATWERQYTTRMWRIDRLPPVPMIEVDCRKFDVDRHALYEYLRHYVDTPDARAELGTEAAVARARYL